MFIWLQSSPLLLTYPLPDRVVRKDCKRIKFIRGISYPTPLDGFCVDAVLLLSLTLQCDFIHHLAELV